MPRDYPEQLREIPDVPAALWVRGSMPPPEHKYLAVVGSRALSAYGREAATSLISGFAGYPISIISGLALGADAAAHRAALNAGLHTIAFPGSGISDQAIAPRTNLGLAKDILASGGALLSEYSPETEAAPWRFPERNRLMVGISHAVLVIEAGDRSGTLITARLAGEYNRDLLCIPHRIGDTHGYGANLFIRLGAALVSESAHILEALGISQKVSAISSEQVSLTGNERIVYDTLLEPLSRDDLIRQSKLASGDALTALVMLEIRGILKEEFGMWRRM
jgi:DNA processing protein